VGWTARQLAEKAEIGFSTLIRLESEEGVPSSHVKTLGAIKTAFEKAELNSSALRKRALVCAGKLPRLK
jgi:transcriptional regulator with XRE-family HTH domain